MPKLLFLLVTFAGSIAPLFLREFLPAIFLIVILVSLCILVCVRRFRNYLTMAILLFSLAFTISHIQIGRIVGDQIPETYEGKDLCLDFQIDELVKTNKHRVVIAGNILRAKECGINGYFVQDLAGKRVRLSWRFQDSEIREGQVWSISARLKRPRGFVNFTGFDYQAWLLFKGYKATGYVSKKIIPQLISEQGLSPTATMRSVLREKLLTQESWSHIALLRALLLGDKSLMTKQQWDVLQQTGTTHLMAISGLHIGLMAFFAFVFTKYLLGFTYINRGFIVLPALMSVGVSGFYAALSGFAVPSQRAWLMVLLINILALSRHKVTPIHIVLAIAILVVFFNPLSALQPGFILSFLAVSLLICGFYFRVIVQEGGVSDKGNDNWNSKFFVRGFWASSKSLVFSQLLLFIGLLSPLTFIGLPLSLISPLANLVAVPVVSFVVMPLSFIAILFSWFSQTLAKALLVCAHYVLDHLWGFLEWTAGFSDPMFVHKPLNMVSVICALALMVVLVLPKELKLRSLGLVFLGVFVLYSPHSEESFRISILDVGQGLAIVTETQNHTVVFDTGAKFSEDFDVGSGIVAPFLQARKRTKIDLLVISHGDNDHRGGLEGLISRTKVTEIVTNAHLAKKLRGRELQTSLCSSYPAKQFDHLKLTILWPRNAELDALKTNNRSCVVLLEVDGFRALLTGDIETKVEHELIVSGSLPKNIDLLVAPHHGSHSSSSQSFIEHVSPKHVVYSAGYKNRYRHPSDKVKGRYAKIGAQQWNTAEQGAISFYLTEAGIAVEVARKTNKRLWFD